MDAIRLAGLRFHALIGDLPHEREVPQPIEVDVDVYADLHPAAASDHLSEGVDYREIYEAVAASVSTDARVAPRLLEALCEKIAARLLAIDRITRVRVRCRKPHAAFRGPVDRVEVEIERP
ncbi:MAG TPA: dihydroneopterin aldolase [Gemmatimonadota bacterium]|nr:dihydroneopterin aldolase [Gemmatimonadota bacterium]